MDNDDQYASGLQPDMTAQASFSPSEAAQHGTMDLANPAAPGFFQEPKEKKRANPLTDLVETEKAFVDQLTGIIRKVAAAWSRSNLPPPELDTMFRSIEAIYKANRGLHAKLKDISADPQSAGELGGLLINWIDDLKKPYETYCNKYSTGFDQWEPVQSNARLGPILTQFSAGHPASSNDGIWTMDSLFILPRTRLGYYLKLYKRLLKNTQNPLLFSAVETLNGLIDTFDARCAARVGGSSPGGSHAPLDSVDEVVIDMRKQTLSPPAPVERMLPPDMQGKTGSETSSNYAGSSTGQRSSRESETTSNSRASTQTMSMPISDLERRLSSDRCLDIFTMSPKPVKLQMNPPTLTFSREMRTSLDVVVRFTPRATGIEVVHWEGHIFLLSDLFLICERMTPDERLRPGHEGADMWLCYPPLSGKVLRVTEINGQPNALQIAVMRKEFLTIETITKEGRDSLISHFKDCIEFSTSIPPQSKTPPPPVPSFNAFPRLQTDNSSVPSPVNQGRGSMSPPSALRSISPTPSNQTRGSTELPPIPNHFGDKSLPPEPPMQIQGSHLPPPGHGGGLPPHPNALRPSASAQPLSHGLPLHPGPNIPPARSMGFMSGPGQGPGGYEQPPPPQNFAPPNMPYAGPAFASSSNPNLAAPHPGHPGMRPPLGHYPPGGPPGAMIPPRPPSEPPMGPGLRGPPGPGGPPPHGPGFSPANVGMSQIPRNNSFAGLGAPGGGLRPMLPSQAQRAVSTADPMYSTEPSPPNSPEQRPVDIGPVTSTISAQMKCKVFLQQQHAQWKSLGAAKLKLYRQEPTNIKQLVVEADTSKKAVLISTIVLTDGVERVGKTGVAVELSDKGSRTGIIYMIQLRTEQAAGGLFDSLIAGSDRAR